MKPTPNSENLREQCAFARRLTPFLDAFAVFATASCLRLFLSHCLIGETPNDLIV